MKFQVCYRCGRLIQWVQGYVSKNGKLIPLDYPSGEPHKHVVFQQEGDTIMAKQAAITQATAWSNDPSYACASTINPEGV